MILFHATDSKNEDKILQEGIKPGCDGVVYFADTAEDSLKFLMLRGISDISVMEVDIPDEEVEESFDHSYSFFKCKAYYVSHAIAPEEISEAYKYQLRR